MPHPDLANATAHALQAELQCSLAADTALPGIVASVHAPGIGLRWSGACGLARRDGSLPLTTAHAFRIASVTKPYTAAVALRLFEQHRLDLFASVAPHLPAATQVALVRGGYAPEHITPWHLLTHGSGLRDHAGPCSPYGDAVLREPARVWTHDEQIELCLSLGGPLAPPGTLFHYSDTGYVILGDLLERVAGQPLHRLLREQLHFERLGLGQTHFEGHEPAPPNQWQAGQTCQGVDVAAIHSSCDSSGGGGLIATTHELALFFRAAVRGELFEQRQTLALALSVPSLRFDPATQHLHAPLMGCRWVGREPAWCHGGFWGVHALHCPGSDVTLALSFNQVPAGPTTLGVPGDPTQPSLADRLAAIAQRACLLRFPKDFMTASFFTPHTVEQELGRTFTSGWHLIDQRRISVFGGNTDDLDPHHIDPAFAARHSPHGKTIAFGFLTLSMLTAMLYEVNHYPLDADASKGWPVNYGFRELRFVAPVVVGSRIRGHFTVAEVRERKPGQKLFLLDCVVEIEAESRPALTALWECVWVTPQAAP